MVTLSFFCKPVLSPESLVCLFLMLKAELRNIWTRAHSQMDTAWVIVPRAARCVPSLTEFCECEACLCVLQVDAGGLMGIPFLHCPAQHTNGCSLACTANKLAIKNPLLVPYGAAEISYEITFLFLIRSSRFFFSMAATYCSY